MPRARKDQVARFAYISYLLLGAATLLATALMAIPSGGNAFYLGGYITVFATVILAPIAVVLSIVRQFWGLEWPLLSLLACIATYLALGFLSMSFTGTVLDDIPQGLLMAGFGILALALSIWHFRREQGE